MMKKEYQKPDFVFEDFTLNANIAGNCGAGLITHSEKASCNRYATASNGHSCYFYDNTVQIFAGTTTGCHFTTQDDFDGDSDTFFGLCYHVSTGATKMFAS